MRKITSSPWGLVQSQDDLGEGVSFVSTASHGGYYVPAEKVAEMPIQLRSMPVFSGQCEWYEEDQDWCIVALAFPHLYKKEERGQVIWAAIKTVHSASDMNRKHFNNKKNYWYKVECWLRDNEKGRELQCIAARWKNENGDLYTLLFTSSHIPESLKSIFGLGPGCPLEKGQWFIRAERISDGVKKHFITKAYPFGPFSEFDQDLILKEVEI